MAKRRRPLSRSARTAVFAKTNGHCHVCAGELDANWCADHVVPHAADGPHALDNYLPVCSSCNRARWHYRPEQIRHILQIGVLLKVEVDKQTQLGQRVQRYIDSRLRRSGRRRADARADKAGPDRDVA